MLTPTYGGGDGAAPRGTTAAKELRPGSRILFLVEAPGSQETYEKRPIAGPAGHVLWQCANAVGLTRSQVSILSVFPSQLTRNEREASLALRGVKVFGRQGFTEEGEGYADEVREAIRKTKPNLIVTFGVPALRTLYPDPRLQKLRGSVLWSEHVNCKFIPTVHPSFILKGNAIYRHVMGADLAKAKREGLFPDIRRMPRSLHLNPSFREAIEFLKMARATHRVASDIENFGPQMDCFSVATSPSEAMCFPLFPSEWDEWEQVEVLRTYAELLGDPDCTKINHNILYDLWFLFHQYGIVPAGPLIDTMVAFSVMFPTITKETSGASFNGGGGSSDKETAGFPKALHMVCSLYSEQPYYKDEGKVVTRADGSSDYEGRHRYNALDSAVAFEIGEKLEEEMDERGYRPAHNLTVRQIGSAIAIQYAGFRVDMAALAEERERIISRMTALQAEIETVIGRKINLASPAQLCAHFYGADGRGVRPYLSKDGRPTCDETALMRIRRRDELPECDLILEWRNLHTLRKMFLNMKFDSDNRFRTSIDLRGSRFGRWATSQTVFGTGGNFQNLDPRMRNFLIAD